MQVSEWDRVGMSLSVALILLRGRVSVLFMNLPFYMMLVLTLGDRFGQCYMSGASRVASFNPANNLMK